jgi:hypothetical protein
MVADVKNGYRLLLFCLVAVLLCSLCACAPSDTDVFDSTNGCIALQSFLGTIVRIKHLDKIFARYRIK